MDERVDVSVVISTYNRCALLPAALAGALSQRAADITYEVLVVDNNSTDATPRTVESFMSRAPRLRYLFEPRQGVSHGRNTGISQAKGAIIAFTDDDVVVSPDWVAQIKRALDEHPEVDFVGGKVLPRWPAKPPAWLTREHWSPLAITDFGDSPFYVNSGRPLCLVCASLAFRREVFEEVGLFSPDFLRCQDHELQVRLWQAKRQGMYVPDIAATANVQAERMTKAYHRRWYVTHGKFCAQMRLRSITDLSDGERIVSELPNLVTLFGTPAFLCREVIRECLHWSSAALRLNEARTFFHENRVRDLLAYIVANYRQHAASRKHSHLGEVRAFTKALWRRKSRVARDRNLRSRKKITWA